MLLKLLETGKRIWSKSSTEQESSDSEFYNVPISYKPATEEVYAVTFHSLTVIKDLAE